MEDIVEAFANYIFGNSAAVQVSDINEKYSKWILNNIGMISAPYNAIKAVGVAILTLYFLIELADKTSHENFTVEHFIRMFIKYIIGYELIRNGLSIFKKIVQFSNSLTSEISLESADGAVNEKLIEAITDLADGIFTGIGCMAMLLLPAIITAGLGIFLSLIFISRVIEMSVRMMFAPIACADIFSEGTRGGGFRYIKKFVAIGIQPAIIVGVYLMASKISISLGGVKTIQGGGTDAFLQLLKVTSNQLLMNIVGVTLAFKAQGIANDILGI